MLFVVLLSAQNDQTGSSKKTKNKSYTGNAGGLDALTARRENLRKVYQANRPVSCAPTRIDFFGFECEHVLELGSKQEAQIKQFRQLTSKQEA